MRNRNKKNQAAFSLLELMIVLVIIGILSAIAYPTYSNHITKARRLQATIALTDLAARMEQYYTEHHTYQGATLANLGSPESTNYYRFVIANTSATAFTIKAFPTGSQKVHDQKCASLSMDQLGNKTMSGAGSVSDCWPHYA